jgi:hypothetical protein
MTRRELWFCIWAGVVIAYACMNAPLVGFVSLTFGVVWGRKLQVWYENRTPVEDRTQP